MIEVGKLYRVKGTIPVRTDDGYLMAAYAYYPKLNEYQKDTLWNEQPLVLNDTIVLVVDLPENTKTELKAGGVHVLIGNRVQYMLKKNLFPL
jgi:hypothetical protein